MVSRRDYSEKRNFIRMAVDCPVRYAVPGEDGVFGGTARDLSGGGVLIESEQAWPSGTVLWIRLVPDHANLAPLEAEGEVVRCEAADGGGFKLGVSIQEIKK